MYKSLASALVVIVAAYFMCLVAAAYLLHPTQIELILYPTGLKSVIPTFMLPIIGFLILLPLLAIASSALDKIDPIPPILFVVGVLAGLGAASGQLSWAAAAIVVALAAGAFAAAWALIVMLWRGESIELESRWGGLGGGLGGWRLSRAASMALLAFVLAAGSVVAVSPRAPQETKKDDQAPAATAKKAEGTPAEAKPPETTK